MHPDLIIDAWEFEGFSIINDTKEKHGLSGINIRVKSKGHLEIETSWGVKSYYPGGKVIVVDVAACVSNNRSVNKFFSLTNIKSIILTVLHEFSHWAEEFHRPDREHTPIWNTFLALYILEEKVK